MNVEGFMAIISGHRDRAPNRYLLVDENRKKN